MSLIDEALSLHAATLEEAAGESVTYRFGDLVIPITKAIRGQTSFDAMRSDGDVVTEVRTADWIIRKTLFVHPNSQAYVEPSIGATITDAAGAVYEVMPGFNATGWRWSTSHRFAYRIHTLLRAS